MWEIPLTAFIIMVGLVLLKVLQYAHVESRSDDLARLTMSINERFSAVEENMTDLPDLKKRVDVLTLKAGFNL